MKTQNTLIAALFSTVFATASIGANAETAKLTVTINGVKEDQGTLMVAGYDNVKSFKTYSNYAFSSAGKADANSMTFTFDVETGKTYAISVMQDLNDNGRFDMKPNGMPGEPYGYSNDSAHMGPPSFQDASILVEGDTNTSIELF